MPSTLSRLRSETNYPAYRTAVGLLTFGGYMVACVIAVAGFLTMSSQPLAIALGIAGAVVAVLLTHLVREICLMAADAADAVIDLATPTEPTEPSSKANLDW